MAYSVYNLLWVFLFPFVKGLQVPVTNCRNANPGPPQVVQDIAFPVGGQYTACLRAVPGTNVYWQFTPDSSSTSLSYRVDRMLFDLTCVTDAGQLLIKVPDQPRLVSYTVVYDADGITTSEIVVYAGTDGTYTFIEGSSVTLNINAWITFYDSSAVQNLQTQIELCQQNGSGAILDFTEGQIRVALAQEELNMCNNPDSNVALLSFVVFSVNASDVFSLVVVSGTCMDPSNPTRPLTYSVTPPTTPPTQVTSNGTTEPSSTQETMVPPGPSDVVPVIAGVVATVVVLIVVCVIVAVISGFVYRRNKPNQQAGPENGRLQLFELQVAPQISNDPIDKGPIDSKQQSPVHQQGNGATRSFVDLTRNSPLLSNPNLAADPVEVAEGKEIVVAYSNPKLAAVADCLKRKHELPMQKLIPFEQTRDANSVSVNVARVLGSELLSPFYVMWTGNYKSDAVIKMIIEDLVNRSHNNADKVVLVQLGGDVNGLEVLVKDYLRLVQLDDDPMSNRFNADVCADKIREQAQQTQIGYINRVVDESDGSDGNGRVPRICTGLDTRGERILQEELVQPSSPQDTPSESSPGQQPPRQEEPRPSPPVMPVRPHPSTPPASERSHPQDPPPSYSQYPEAHRTPQAQAVERLQRQAGEAPYSEPGSRKNSPLSSNSDTALVLERIDKLEGLIKNTGTVLQTSIKSSGADLKAAVDDTKAAVGNVENKVDETKTAVDELQDDSYETREDLKELLLKGERLGEMAYQIAQTPPSQGQQPPRHDEPQPSPPLIPHSHPSTAYTFTKPHT